MVKPSDSRNPGITRKGAPRTGTVAVTGGAADIRLPLITFSTIGSHNRIQTLYNNEPFVICLDRFRLVGRKKRRGQKKRTPKSALFKPYQIICSAAASRANTDARPCILSDTFA